MNGSVKRVILGEAIVLVAWLVIMFVCKNALMNPIVFVMSLGFGVLAFAMASISAATKAFIYGVLSGAVEPIAAILTILAAGIIVPVLPYLLSFAAGAMLYVVVEELIPEMSEGKHSNIGTLMFSLGFTIMMTLDVALG